MSCIFCKIADGEIASATIYALILPKKHYADLYEIPADLAGKAMILAKKMVKVMTEALHCDGYNVVQNNGEAAGQTVFHFHVHLIPRYKGDQAGVTWEPGTLTEEDKKDILEKVSQQMS